MYRDLKRACRTIVLLIKPFFGDDLVAAAFVVYEAHALPCGEVTTRYDFTIISHVHLKIFTRVATLLQ